VRNSFFFSTGAKSRKSKNLQANPKCIVCPEGAAEGVILEGVAGICSDRDFVNAPWRTRKNTAGI